MLETLDYTIRIGSIPTFLYFDFNSYIVLLYMTSQSTLRLHVYMYYVYFTYSIYPVL